MDQSDFNLLIKEDVLLLRQELHRLREELVQLREKTPVLDAGDFILSRTGVQASGLDYHAGRGERISRYTISFSQSFTAPPSVAVSLRGLDTRRQANTRIEAQAEAVTKIGFTLLVRTWFDSEIYGAWVTWLAHGT